MALPLSSLTLFPATPAQVYESRKRSFVQWGRGVSLEAYLRRDARMDNHEVARDGRLTTWYRREGLLANRQEGKNIPQKVFGYGIASVFTPTEHRKKGYARHMMRLLHWILAPKLKLPVGTFPPEWGAPPERPGHIFEAAFSVLYSDVGADFYAQCGPYGESNGGWILTEPTATTWSLPTIFENETLLAAKETGQLAWKWLGGSSTNEIWDADAKLFADEMKTAATGKPIEVTFLPQKGVAGFQYHRLQYFWEKLEPIPKFWSICAQSGSGEDAVDPTTFASWTLDIRPPDENALIITRLRARPEHFLELLAQILEYARQYKVDRVEVWGLPRELRELATSTGGKTFARDDHLSSFKSYLKEKPEDIAWIHNEKFCWC
ncbi:hypothetical protein NLJ89_g10380 [Agrocybe chaxingu]|uniref:LYC1 C-terminal domain-containing protein n=1 Tax=Agrocybe chaxingu TaxID=84603 RepID=A0A9W8JR91_9AGAR|nr:hypothetical protein NLJ89_g10380 [Agrocybe chaxingu]